MAHPPRPARVQKAEATGCDGNLACIDRWQIENSLHFVKDRWWHELLRWWHEDRHDLSRPGLGAVFATITNFALSILRNLQPPGDSLVETAENIRYFPRKTLQYSRINGF